MIYAFRYFTKEWLKKYRHDKSIVVFVTNNEARLNEQSICKAKFTVLGVLGRLLQGKLGRLGAYAM